MLITKRAVLWSSSLIVAAALLLLLFWAVRPESSHGQTGVNDSTPGQVNQVAVDMDTTGNPTGSGGLLSSIQSSAVLPVGNTLDIDVIVDEIDPSDGMPGFFFNLKFNPAVLQITSKDTNSFMLTGAISCCSDPIPNASGNVLIEAAWIGGSASGEGVLVRLTIQCLAIGLSALDLSNDIDQTGIPTIAESVTFSGLDVLNTLDGEIFCGSPLPTATLTVSKDFSDNNTDAVEVIVTCGPGATPDHPFSKYVTEVTPVDFTISVGSSETCDVVESPTPTGYVVDDSDCQNVIVSAGGSASCTIINTFVGPTPTPSPAPPTPTPTPSPTPPPTPTPGTLTVNKDFSDDNPASVGVAVFCDNGVVLLDSFTEITAADFTIPLLTGPTTCTASEGGLVTGYSEDFSDCQNVSVFSGSTPSCTIINTLVPPGDTPTGDDVPVSLEGGLGSPGGVELTFDNVTGGGTTTVTTSTTGEPPPTGLKIVGFGGEPVYYEITTTATFTGLVTVCIAYDETQVEAEGQESSLKLMHDDGSGFTDITSSLDTINNIICGETATLSPFALMVPIPPEGPPAVGGIVELLTGSDAPASAGAGSGSSASIYAAVVGAIAAGTLALAAGGMYVRRRRVG